MWRKKLLLAIVSSILSVGTAVAVLLATGIVDSSLLARFQAPRVVSDYIKIWQFDPVLGWSHRPSSTLRHAGLPEFDVLYNIDSNGSRLVPGARSGPEMLVLGGSFTFGYGVADHDAFPALLQKFFPETRVVNLGCMAWGTVHAWINLNRALDQTVKPMMVIYGFIDHHRHRNWLRRSWLETLREKNDFLNPRVEIVDEQIVWQELADPEEDGLQDSAALDEAENEITARLLDDMALRCRNAGVRFLVVYLPDGSDFSLRHPLRSTFDRLAEEGSFTDLRPVIDHADASFADNHLSPKGHRMVSLQLQEAISSRLRSLE